MDTIQITITDRDGMVHKVNAPTDMNMNVMELIRSYELAEEGTIGVCGGMAMCASCQCYISKGAETLPEMGDEEEAMLSEAFNTKDSSRLSCQLFISSEVHGLEIEIAPEE